MTRRLPASLMIGLMFALGGCNLAPPYVRPLAPVPAILPEGGVYPVAATDAPDITAIAWQQFFTDPRLRQVIALSLDNNRDLRIALGNVLQARAQYRVQRADQLPTIGANGSATFTNSPGTGSGPAEATGGKSDSQSYSVDVGVSAFELDLFGRARNLSRAALERYLASDEGQRSTRITLIAEVANTWLTMASDQDQLRLSQETLDSYQQALTLTRARFRVGISSELDARQAEASYEGARNDIAVLRTRITQDQNALNLLAGTTIPATLLPVGLGTGTVTIDTLPAAVPSTVLLRRPDVLRAEHLLIAENANIGAARAAFFPTISLTGALGLISGGLGSLFSSGSSFYQASPAVSLPIFDGGRNAGNLAYAGASQQVAVSTYEKAIQTAFREVADALAQRGTIDEQVAAQTARTNAARVTANLSYARYNAGVDSFLTSLDSQRTYYSAQQQLVSTRLARNQNLVELYRALGGGLADPLVRK